MKRLKKVTGEIASASHAQSSIQDVLQAYETALNASDTGSVMNVFASDSVFMAPNSPSAVGADAIRAAYDGLFQKISFETELTVEEVVQASPSWAFVRTHSKVFVNVRAIGQRVPDANHELFVLHKGNEKDWKIARYSFATTNPPPQ